MSNTPLVSVITPAYGSELVIGETIESVLAQDYPYFEFIIVNDGSPDDLERVVLSYQKKDTRIRFYKQGNQGMCATRNNAIGYAKGEYLAFLDNDDLWAPDNLSKKVQFLNENESVGLVHSDTEIVDEEGIRQGKILSGKSGHILEDLLLWNGTCVPAPSSVVVRKSVHDQTPGFDPLLSIAGDKDYFIQVAHKFSIGRISEVTWFYRVHENNFHKRIDIMEKDERRVIMKNKKAGLYKSRSFQNRCVSNTLLIVGKSWWKDGGNPLRGASLILEALWFFPTNVKKLI